VVWVVEVPDETEDPVVLDTVSLLVAVVAEVTEVPLVML
jgi:hypothetical protein